jgi:hypothetical protein
MGDSFACLFIYIDALIEFNASDEEINEIRLFIMGDDNSAFTHWSLIRLDDFLIFLESYALSRYGMVLSRQKSILTPMRNKIETLSYQCNFGMPTRPIGKLVAQLCYPERGPRPKFMSARAVGMAWASCGQNQEFHDFCRDIFYEFFDDRVQINESNFHLVQSHLPGFLRIDESLRQIIDFQVFPSMDQVRHAISSWKGPLSFQPKWDLAHFVLQPDITPPDSLTLHEYMKEHSLSFNIYRDLFSL